MSYLMFDSSDKTAKYQILPSLASRDLFQDDLLFHFHVLTSNQTGEPSSTRKKKSRVTNKEKKMGIVVQRLTTASLLLTLVIFSSFPLG